MRKKPPIRSGKRRARPPARKEIRLHPKTHELLVKSLAAASAAADTQKLNTTLTRLMVLLAQYGALEQEAIETGTLLSDAVPRGDMAMLSFDIDGIWKFPTGQGYNRDGSNINPGWIVDRLAGDINSRGGTVIH